MVDDLGGLEEAIDAAASWAASRASRASIYPRRPLSIRDLLSAKLGLSAATDLLPTLPSLRTPLYLMH